MNNMYVQSSKVPVVENSHLKPYVLAIRDLPPEQKPREKLIREGGAVLSMPELLAIILGIGTRKEELSAMTSRILKEYGEKSIISERNPKKLSADLDIPLVRATQIVAAVEFGRRLFERNPAGAKVIRTAKDVHAYTKNMRDLPKEHLRGIYLNNHYKIIHDEVISIGTIDANIVHPREVFRPALEYASSAVILVHNHPSGSLLPSDADILVTRQLIEAGKLLGIELIDHVIVSSRGFISIMSGFK